MLRGRIKHILNNNGKIKYYDMENKTFKDNLILVDSLMNNIIAETLLYFYRDGITECKKMIKNHFSCYVVLHVVDKLF